jgi:hypothetical protein
LTTLYLTVEERYSVSVIPIIEINLAAAPVFVCGYRGRVGSVFGPGRSPKITISLTNRALNLTETWPAVYLSANTEPLRVVTNPNLSLIGMTVNVHYSRMSVLAGDNLSSVGIFRVAEEPI